MTRTGDIAVGGPTTDKGKHQVKRRAQEVGCWTNVPIKAARSSTRNQEVEDLSMSPPTSARTACLCIKRRPEWGASESMGTSFLSLCPSPPPLYTPSILSKLWFSELKWRAFILCRSKYCSEGHGQSRESRGETPEVILGGIKST